MLNSVILFAPFFNPGANSAFHSISFNRLWAWRVLLRPPTKEPRLQHPQVRSFRNPWLALWFQVKKSSFLSVCYPMIFGSHHFPTFLEDCVCVGLIAQQNWSSSAFSLQLLLLFIRSTSGNESLKTIRTAFSATKQLACSAATMPINRSTLKILKFSRFQSWTAEIKNQKLNFIVEVRSAANKPTV